MNPTKCPHCGTVAAEWHCHICKRDKINAAPQAEIGAKDGPPAVAAPDIGYECAWPHG